MIGTKVTSKIVLEHGKAYKYRTRIVSLDCFPESDEYHKYKFGLLKQLSEDPTLSLCNSVGFQKMSMEHTGKNWEIICEAIVKEKD
jgi:hypothetical protein